MDASAISETEWVEYFDDNTQQPYYIHKTTQQSQFEIPDEYEEWKQQEIEKYLKTTNWRRRKDEKRDAYFYFNKTTGKTQWEVPLEEEEFVEFLKNVNIDRTDWGQESGGEGDEGTFDEPPQDDDYETSYQSRDFGEPTEEEDGEHREEESNAKELELLETKLSAKDAIMEPSINQTIHKYLRLASDATPGSVVTKLSQSYVGYAQLTHVMCSWITLVNKNFDEEAFIAKEMSDLIKRKFNKDIADRLIDEHTGVPGWLHDMMHDPTWRKLLIELFDESSHKGSVLLGYCLRYLSSQGFHREIAHIIREADYFQVFNDLLIDSISRISRELTGTAKPHNPPGGGAEDSVTLTALLNDLKRMCSSSEYMFFYAQELLAGSEDALKQRSLAKKRKASESIMEEGEATEEITSMDLTDEWRKKMRRLSQELEEAVIWSEPNENILPLSRSRSFSLRLTRLFGSQLITDDLPANQTISGMYLHRLLQLLSSVLDDDDLTDPKIAELCEIFFGIEKTLSDAEFALDFPVPPLPIQAFLESSADSHLSLLFNFFLCPRFLTIMTRSFIHPIRSTRKPYSPRRMASLLSLSALLQRTQQQRFQAAAGPHWDTAEMSRLMATLLTSAEMCIEMTGLGVSLNLTTSARFQSFLESLNDPLVSMVCLYWTRCSVSDIQFLRGSRQCAIYPVVMQMIVQAIDLFPLQREECLEILKLCYYTACVGMVDSGENKQDVSKDIIDIIVHLMGRGLLSSAMDFLRTNFHLDSLHRFDTALIRHLFMKLFSVISPPYSSLFTSSLVDLVLHPSARKALESQHFTAEAVSALRRFSDTMNSSDLDSKKLEDFRRVVVLSGRPGGGGGAFYRR